MGIGSVAVPALVNILRDVDAHLGVRAQVATALGAMGSVAESAVSALIDALQDPNSYVCYRATLALGQMGAAAAAAIPTLVRDLGDPRHTVRHTAAVALEQVGPVAMSALPVLDEMRRHDENYEVRHQATRAMRFIIGEGQDQ